MFLLVKRISLIIFGVTLFFTLLVQGVIFYKLLSLPSLSKDDAIFWGESLLFSSIIICLGVAWVLYGFTVNSRKIDDELNRLGEASERNSYVPSRAKRTLGALGVKINRIVATISHLSEIRRNQVLAQTNLINLIAEKSHSVFFVVNTEGKIRYVSDEALEHFKVSYSDVIDSYIKSISPDLNFDKAVSDILHSSGTLSFSQNGLVVYPAMAGHTPHYFLIVLDSSIPLQS